VLDSIGRPWQLGTIQLDYSNPERFDLAYVGEDNNAHRPVIIHRAVSGSLERFIAILIEHFAGAFPIWLAPEQVRVLPITDEFRPYAEQVTKGLHDAGVRVHLDARSETLKYRVAEGARMKVPYMLVVGRREAEQGTVAVNVRGAGEKQKPNAVPLDQFVARVREENRTRSLVLAAQG
jgi:threonyl-tRNA synthetase